MQLNIIYGISNEEDYVKDHKEILKTIKDRDGDMAAHLMEEHLSKSLKLLIKR